MKRLFTLLVLALAGSAAAFAQSMSNNGHQLTQLWASYDQARKDDLPQKEAEILSQIKQEAQARRLAVDFYDAATQYVGVVQRRDWKQRESALKTLGEEVKAFDEPIVTVLWLSDYQNAATDYQWAYVKDNLDRFQGRNSAFYRNIGSYLGGNLAPFIQNDKEYVLWRLLQRRSYSDIEKDEIYRLLKEEVKGRYPAQPALEYYALGAKYRYSDQLSQRVSALKAFQEAYKGKSVSMYAKGELLKIRMDQLEKDKASSAEFEALYKDCEAFEKERAAFTGDDERIVRGIVDVKALCERLTEQSLDVRVDKNEITVVFQNLNSAKVELFDGRKEKPRRMKSWTLPNPANSFFVRDTARIAMPVLSDGHYQVEVSGGEEINARATYNQYTLSIAVRNTSKGWQVYVADHKSGEPLEKATLKLFKNGRQLASGSVKLNGFTPLPKAIAKKIALKPEALYDLVAESGKRASTEVSLSNYTYYGSDYSGINCNIYRDRGAYNPGDTLRFKAIVYKGDPKKALAVREKMKLEAVLWNSEYKEIGRKDLVTNEFGSVSGEFVLPKGQRNGQFTLSVREKGGSLGGSTSFRVDEFVLPSFDLRFDTREELFLVGDQIPVSGKLESYSGHSLAGARVNLKVMRDNTLVLDQEEPVKADNTFSFTFQAREPGYYRAEAIVTDATGEMRSFYDHHFIGNRIWVSMVVRNAADGSFELPTNEDEPFWRSLGYANRRSAGQYLIQEDKLVVRLSVNDEEGNRIPLPLQYTLLDSGDRAQRQGQADSGSLVEIDLADLPSGLYRLRASARTKAHHGDDMLQDEEGCLLLLSRPADRELTPLVKRMLVSGPTTVSDGKISMRLGATYGPAYVVATLFGEDKQELASQCHVFAQGVPGEVAFDYADSYPDAVRLQVFYFMDGESVSFERQYRRERSKLFLPLKFSRFTSNAYPHTEYIFTLKTTPGVEALAAAWDKSLDAIAANYWPVVDMLDYSVPYVSISSTPGHITGEGGREPIPHVMYKKRLGGMMDDSVVMEEAVAMAAPAPMMTKGASNALVDRIAAEEDSPAPVVRTDFASALTFQPHLRTTEDGTLEFSIRTSDKLSTYYVAVYAHGKDMRNALVKEEMVVSLPVKVALVQPQFLYAGDRYEAALSVSSIADEPVSGRLQLRYGDSMQEVPITVPAGGVESRRFLVVVPESASVSQDGAPQEITLTASFVADEFSDAVQVKVPVYPAAQVLTESHSAVLLSGQDREALLKELRSRFVNVPGSAAALREITVLDMVKDAIPDKVNPAGKDVLSLSEAWYVRLLAGKLSGNVSPEMSTEELLKKMMACQNADGGFGWFEGMSSSAIITAVMLERFAKLRSRGFEVPFGIDRAVKFLDKTVFGTSFPVWRGWVEDSQYVYVRSFYPEVPFAVKPVTKADKKRLADFQKWAKSYLTPSKKDGRGLQGRILSKARRLLTLENLGGSDEGVVLAQAWGISLEDSKGEIRRSIHADISSLLQYAVEHRDGGWYYPNAVMPGRGLMESEAYAHALLCDLLSRVVASGDTAAYSDIEQARTISNGIRIWLMLQKETQKWETDPAYIDAVTSILDGPDHVLDTRVLALSATYEAPFSRIKAAGNGFTVARKFYRMGSRELLYDDTTSDVNEIVATLEEIQPGDPVKVGEKILVRYEIWNAENRSFVKLDAGREAALRPVQQLSGHLGWGYIRPARGGYSWGFVPQGYRNVKASRTEFFFDSYPEEKTTLSEEFFVTQSGAFVAPVVTIESLYAPHYRANSASRGVQEVSAE